MLLPVSLWILLTTAALVISLIGLVIGISSRARMDAIAKRTENLEKELDHYRNSLNRERERLVHIESEQLRINEAADLVNKVSALKQNMSELETRKQSLQTDIKVQAKLHDQQLEELKRLVSERQQQDSLRRELAGLGEQVAQEEKKRDDTIQEISELQNSVASLRKEHERLKSEIEEFQSALDAEDTPGSEERTALIVKRRIVKKHGLGIRGASPLL
jgi:chromosome segregation ATPase